jgi:hypothetical protein
MVFVIYKTPIEILKIKVQNAKLRKSSRQGVPRTEIFVVDLIAH